MSGVSSVIADKSHWFTITMQFMHLIRFSHTIFALPFALLATVWAYVVPLPPSEPTLANSWRMLPASEPTQAESWRMLPASEPTLTESWRMLPASEPTLAASATTEILRPFPTYLEIRWQSLLGILLCMVTARSFAMAMNRLLDHRWDGENPRTSSRHLPAKILTRSSVGWFSAGCAMAFVASCALFLPNILPLVLCIPVLVFLAGYSFAKRFTNLVHFWLGAALMLAPICAWIALRGEIVQSSPWDILPALLLGIVVFLWVSGFDIIYACQDADYDRGAGLFSIPAWLGVRNALRVAAACHASMWCVALMLSFALPTLSLGWPFRSTLVVVGLLLIYEHSLISERNLMRMQLAFFQLNSIISVLFLAVGTIDACWR